MTERERAQERPDCRGSHRTERQHPIGGTGSQHVDMINVRRASNDRRDDREDLATRTRRAGIDMGIDQVFQAEPVDQCRGHDQPSIRDQTLVIEDRFEPVDTARSCTHKKCLLWSGFS